MPRLLTERPGTFSSGTAVGYEVQAGLQGSDSKVFDSVWLHIRIYWLQSGLYLSQSQAAAGALYIL